MKLEDAENELRGTIKLGLVDSVSGYIEAAEDAFEAALVIIKARESRIAELEKRNTELEKERDEAREDAKSIASSANIMIQSLEHRDYPYAIAIIEKYK